MKIIISILFITFAINLSAQEKHSELYNQVDSIYKANTYVYNVVDSTRRIKLYSKTTVTYGRSGKPFIILDGIPYDNYIMLDSLNMDDIHSIELQKRAGDIGFSNSNNGVIIIYTKEAYETYLSKKKKRKSNY